MRRWLQILFFALVVRPLVLVVLGLNVRGRERLPLRGPAVVVANHNSHLDTLVLMSLYPLHALHRIRPVAAADYFLRNRMTAWLSRTFIGILPVERGGGHARESLAAMGAALEQSAILILYPEGTRGEPERLAAFRGGVARLASERPGLAVVPVFMHGLGKALPRGEGLLVPFFCDVFVGEALRGGENNRGYLRSLEAAMKALADQGHFPDWE